MPRNRSCGSYGPGHLMRWIQAKKSHEDGQPIIKVKVAAVHDDGRLEIESDDLKLTLWYHSVAKPNGELHDTTGVWIADASGMPSCSGVNPMVSTMALARRTATNMLSERCVCSRANHRKRARGGRGGDSLVFLPI